MHVTPQQVVEYPYEDHPPAGTAREVAPGIHWLRMPLPFALDHINLYLLEDGDGWTLIDCGYNSADIKALWPKVWESTLGGRPIKRIIVTHFHPDHIGMAGWIKQRYDAELWMSHTEWLAVHFAWSVDHDRHNVNLEFWRRNGLDGDTLHRMESRVSHYHNGVSLAPHQFHRMRDGHTVEIGGRSWEVIVGRGHSPEHVCLYCDEIGVLLSGDQVLPRITTNVSVHFYEPDANPLRQFLESTGKFAHLRNDTLVLCSHNRPFYHLHARLQYLRDHHQVRLDDAYDFCAEKPRTAVEMLPVLFHRELNIHQMTFAIGESIAHLHHLYYGGRLRRDADGDGVYRFSPAK